MKIIEGGVTAAKGFKAAAVAAEIKYKGRTDMAMVYSEVPCVAAGTFTTNVVKAAPVKWDQDIVYNHPSAQVVICNSGIANACTGAEGYGYCKETADAAAEVLGVTADSVLVASTGVIGKQIPIERIKNGVKMLVPKLDGSLEAGTEAAKAIMTTDTKKKEVAVQIEIGGKTVTVGGMCKGSGMIHPNMCTMLGFVTTDAKISKKMLQEALSEDVKDTYNMVSVDGDTSTNDTVLLLANGLAENPEITEKGEDYQTFKAALNYINTTLAGYFIREIQKDKKTLEEIDRAVQMYNQCLVYCDQGAEDLAVIQLKKAVQIHPSYLKAYQLLALLYLKTGQYQKAKQVLQRAHRLDTTNETTLKYMHELSELRETQGTK